jgi:hypothetical protein
MSTFQLTPPNTCAIIDLGSSNVSYISEGTGYSAVIVAPSSAISFQEFTNPEDALAAALLIDPAFPAATILGSIPYTVDTQTGSGSYFYGDTVTLEYVVSSTLAGTVVTYQWYDEGNLALPGETSSTLNLGGASASVAGAYTCTATLTATDGTNRVASSSASFSVTATPSPASSPSTANTPAATATSSTSG